MNKKIKICSNKKLLWTTLNRVFSPIKMLFCNDRFLDNETAIAIKKNAKRKLDNKVNWTSLRFKLFQMLYNVHNVVQFMVLLSMHIIHVN